MLVILNIHFDHLYLLTMMYVCLTNITLWVPNLFMHARASVGIPPFLLMGLLGAFIPSMYRAFAIGRPAFGSTSLVSRNV